MLLFSVIRNLLAVYECFTGLDRATIESRFAGKGYGDFKKELIEVLVAGLQPIRSRYDRLTRQPDYVQTVLLEGAEKIRPIAERVFERVRARVGLG